MLYILPRVRKIELDGQNNVNSPNGNESENMKFIKNITRDQARDTGMAMTLILLILGFYLKNDTCFMLAVPALLLTMTIPALYKPLAVVWLGFSRMLGKIVSRIILTLIFFVIVTPVGLIRRILGYDSLKLKQFKKDDRSVMHERDVLFDRKSIEKPF